MVLIIWKRCHSQWFAAVRASRHCSRSVRAEDLDVIPGVVPDDCVGGLVPSFWKWSDRHLDPARSQGADGRVEVVDSCAHLEDAMHEERITRCRQEVP